MANTFNIYCDESCHLENDKQPVMLLGAIWCPLGSSKRLSNKLKDIMRKHRASGELKWNKVSLSRQSFYLEVIDWFLDCEDLKFRALVVSNKSDLNHDFFNQGSHDVFYYKCYFSLLNKIISPDQKYNIYLDIKDTRSRRRIKKLKDVLCNNVYDFTGQMIHHIQNIHSHESLLMQLCDFLLGAVSYANRELTSSSTKQLIVNTLQQKLGYKLVDSTSLLKNKVNLFIFSPQKVIK